MKIAIYLLAFVFLVLAAIRLDQKQADCMLYIACSTGLIALSELRVEGNSHKVGKSNLETVLKARYPISIAGKLLGLISSFFLAAYLFVYFLTL